MSMEELVFEATCCRSDLRSIKGEYQNNGELLLFSDDAGDEGPFGGQCVFVFLNLEDLRGFISYLKEVEQKMTNDEEKKNEC